MSAMSIPRTESTIDGITIFLDIDGTLLDISQKPTADSLPDIINRLIINKGVSFGLNSNRAFEDVVKVIDQFRLTGPFILENGAIMIDRDGTVHKLADVPVDIQGLLIQKLTEFNEHARVELVDTTSLYTGDNNPESHLAIFVNKFRKYSGSVHHRMNGESQFSIAKSIADYLNEYFNASNLKLTALAHKHGNTVTVEQEGVDKGTGLDFYKTIHPNQKIYAIGDGINDLTQKTKVDRLYAVANAVQDLKDNSYFTSSFEITAGVEEILLQIEKEIR